MTTYRVNILTPGHMMVFRSKRARSPVRYDNVSETELAHLVSQARRSMLKYDVTDESKIEKETVIEEIEIQKEDEDIEIEELVELKEPSTILEKLLVDNN